MFFIIATHLANQRYTVCIRKPSAAQRICYVACTSVNEQVNAGANVQSSFGLRLVVTNTIHNSMLHDSLNLNTHNPFVIDSTHVFTFSLAFGSTMNAANSVVGAACVSDYILVRTRISCQIWCGNLTYIYKYMCCLS